MENNFKNIDDLFKEELGGYTEAPPPPVWQALEKRLDDDRKRRLFPFRWYWFISLISFVVLFGASVTWKMAKEDHSSQAAIAEPKAMPANTAQQEGTPATSTAIAATTTAHVAHKKMTHHQPSVKHHQHKHHKTTIQNNDTETPAIAEKTTQPVKAIQHTNYNSSNSSVYTYEDDEMVSSNETVNVEPEEQPQGYVVSKTKKHNIVAADMVPVPGKTVAHTKHVTDESNEPAASERVTNNSDVAVHKPTKKAHRHIAKQDTHSPATATVAKKESIKKPLAKKPQSGKDAGLASVAKSNEHKPAPNYTKQAAIEKPQPKVDVKHMPLAAGTPAAAAIPVKTQPKRADNKTAVHVNKPSAHTAAYVKPLKEQKPAIANVASTSPVTVAPQPAGMPKQEVKHTVKPETKNVATHKAKEPKSNKLLASSTPTAPATKAQAKLKAAKTIENKKASDAAVVKKDNKTVKPAPASANTVLASSTPVADARKEKTASVKTKVQAKKAVNGVAAIAKTDKEDAKEPVNTTTGQSKKTGSKTKAAKINPVVTKVYAAAPAPAPKPAVAKTMTSSNKPAVRLRPNLNNDGVAEEPVIINSSTPDVATAKQEETPVQAKKENAPIKDSTANAEAKDNARDIFRMFVYGIKGGYEGSSGNGGANKGVISPFLEYKLNKKFSLMTQPAFKVSQVTKHNIGNAASYYDTAGSEHHYAFQDSVVVHFPPGVPDMWRRNYAYTQTYDSIVKTYAVGGTTWEVELPLLLKYSINSKLSVYGGVNANYSRFVPIKESTFTKEAEYGKPIFTLGGLTQAAPDPSTGLGTVTLPGTSIANYNGPLYPSQDGGALKLGYMLGLSYEFKKRWMIDALIQQSKIKSHIEGGYNANTALALPYFRLTLGYRLSK